MHGYKAYIIGQDGRIRDRIDLFCEDEDEAKSRAKMLVDGHAVELWERAQKIARFEPNSNPHPNFPLTGASYDRRHV